MSEEAGAAAGKTQKSIWRRSFDKSLLVFAILASATGFAVYWFNGEAAFQRTVREAWDLLLFIMPRVGAAVIIAAFLQIIVPREVVSRLIGEKAGIGSVLIATIAGISFGVYW